MTKKTAQKSTTTWTEVAKVAIKRGVTEQGRTPLFLTQHVGEGELPNGRTFRLALNLGGGSLVVMVDGSKSDPDDSRTYVIDPREVLEAIAAAEFPT